MYECSMKEYDESKLTDGKILYQPIEKISTANMDEYAQYILN